MEPTGEAKESDVKEQITIVNGGREKVGEAVTRKGGMEKLPQGPTPPTGSKGLSQSVLGQLTLRFTCSLSRAGQLCLPFLEGRRLA